MIKLLIYIILSFYIFSCGSGDKQAYLRELEEKRDALSEEIEQLNDKIEDLKEENAKTEKLKDKLEENLKEELMKQKLGTE